MKNHLCVHSYLGYNHVSKWLKTTEKEEVKELRGFSNRRLSTVVMLERVINLDAKF